MYIHIGIYMYILCMYISLKRLHAASATPFGTEASREKSRARIEWLLTSRCDDLTVCCTMKATARFNTSGQSPYASGGAAWPEARLTALQRPPHFE